MAVRLVIIVALALTASTTAQRPPSTEAEAGSLRFTFTPVAEWQFDGDVDEGGDVSVTSLGAAMSVTYAVNDGLDLAGAISYREDAWDFDSATAFGGDPWGDVDFVGTSVRLEQKINEEWTVFGGPLARWAREDGADWDDAFMFGGAIGAVRVIRPGLVVGGGLGLVEQIEDSTRVFPIIIVQWQIRDRLRLASSAKRGGGRQGLELIYALNDEWDLALGGGYSRSRFRLDDDGIAPDGVGEVTSIPFWLRLSGTINEHCEISVYGGVDASGEIRLEDSHGDRIAREDADTRGFIAALVTIRF